MRVTVAGGGFCGLEVAKQVSGQKDIDLTLIDKKEEYVYYPSLHKLIKNPDYLEKITVPYTDVLEEDEFYQGEVEEITPDHVKTKDWEFEFDNLVISLGVKYPIYLEDKDDVYTVTSADEALEMSNKISEAEDIIVIGGGLIGTEASGELITDFPDKKITLVHSKDKLVERNHPSASEYARKFLEKKGVDIIFNEKVVKKEGEEYRTDKDRTIKADMGIWSAGIDFDTSFMNSFEDDITDEAGRLKVDEYLRLKGYDNIFVGGDLTDIDEEKTGAHAEIQALTIAKNLKIAAKGKTSFSEYVSRPIPLAIGLGNKNAMAVYSSIVMPGPLSKLGKMMVEKATVSWMRL